MNKFHEISEENIQIIVKASQAEKIKMYYKLKIKCSVINKNIWFNSQCIKRQIFPKYINNNFRINNKSSITLSAIKIAKKYCLKKEIRKWYKIRASLFFYLYVLHKELNKFLHQIEFNALCEKIAICTAKIIIRKTITQKKKLHQLYRQQYNMKHWTATTRITHNDNNMQLHEEYTHNKLDQHNGEKTENKDNINFFQRIVNLTQTDFNESELNVIQKGLKYTPQVKINKNILQDIAIETELAINKINNTDNKLLTKLKCLDILRDPKNKRQNKHIRDNIKTVNNLKNKILENDLITVKADKGQTVVIMKKEDYNEKVTSFLIENNFKELKDDPTKKYNIEIRKTLDDCKDILTAYKIQKCKIMNPTSPKLTGYPKLHKENIPIRPVCSTINSPTYKAAKEMNNILKNILPKNKYTIKNHNELINNIKDIKIPNNAKLVSFDVVNLFTNIPIDECCMVVENLLKTTKTPKIQIQQIMTLLRTIISQNYLTFNYKFYKQDEGLAMGSPISPLLADTFMNNIEKIIFHKHNANNNIIYWYRYVDDILCLWNGTSRQLQKFLQEINSLHDKIKFTMEIEKDNQINFLDIKILKKDNKHDFSIFRKETYSDIVIHKDSNTCTKYKHAAFNNMVNRALTVPMNKANLNKEINIIKQIAINNGFNQNIIDNIKKNINLKKAIQTGTKLTYNYNKKEPVWVSIPYYGQISEKIGAVLCKEGLNVGYKTKNKLGSVISRVKDVTNKLERSGVYKLKCTDCPGVYIGQTGRKFNDRINEHLKTWKNNKKGISNFADHLIDKKHNFSKDSVEILHLCGKSKKLDILEQFEIHKCCNRNEICLNDITYIDKLPLLLSPFI